MCNYHKYELDDVFMRNFMPYEMIPAKSNFERYDTNPFVSSSEGFKLGNLQKGTYIPYKNYKPINPIIINQRQSDLLKLQEMCFAAHEINLYLDTHPNDRNAINLFNNYNKEAEVLQKSYEKKYGPIDLSDGESLDKTPWNWIKEPWPWNE